MSLWFHLLSLAFCFKRLDVVSHTTTSQNSLPSRRAFQGPLPHKKPRLNSHDFPSKLDQTFARMSEFWDSNELLNLKEIWTEKRTYRFRNFFCDRHLPLVVASFQPHAIGFPEPTGPTGKTWPHNARVSQNKKDHYQWQNLSKCTQKTRTIKQMNFKVFQHDG